MLFGKNKKKENSFISEVDDSRVLFVISLKSEEVMCLLEGVYGLKLLIPITLFSFHFVSHLCVHISNSC